MNFFEALDRCMKERGMRYSELAKRTGLYPAYFSKLKRGQARDVTWERALVIIDAIDMTPDEFVAVMRSE